MPSTKVIFLVLPNVHLLDLAGVDQVFYEAIEHGADIQIEYCSFTDHLYTSTHLPFGSLRHFSDVSVAAGDYIFIPGSDVAYLNSEELHREKALFDWVVEAYEKKVTLCTICTGAFFLAVTGLLDGKTCTTHWKRTGELQAKYPRLRVLENILFTEDDRIYTSAGVTSGIDMALHIIGAIRDDYMAYKIARELVVYNRRPGNQAQQSIFLNYRNHIHSCIHRVQDWLQENIDKKVTLDELAEIACMSTRTLTRTFKRETSISVNEYITLIRKERINELMKNPDMTRAQIARKCGLKSERQVTRIIKKELV